MAKGCGKDPCYPIRVSGGAKDGIHSLYKPVISYEDGGVGVKETCHRGTAPSFRSAVHYVVVKQGGVMEKFRRSRKLYGVVVRSPHCIGTEKCQGRPHHLAGIFPEGTVGGVKKGYVRAEGVFYDTLHLTQPGLQICFNLLQNIPAVLLRFQGTSQGLGPGAPAFRFPQNGPGGPSGGYRSRPD